MFGTTARFAGTVLTALALSAMHAQEPLTLESAVAVALDRNPLPRSALDESDAARARIEQALSPRKPRLDFSQSITRGDQPVYVFGSLLSQGQFTQANFALPELNDPAAHDNVQTRVGGAWTLFDFGRTSHQAGAARQSSTAQDFQVEQERQDLILRVVRAYHVVQVAQASLAAARAAREAAESSAARVRALDQAGQVVASDLLSIQVRVASMAEREIRASSELELARLELATELGVDLESIGEPGPGMPELRAPVGSLEDYEEAALAGRSALRAAELELEAARAGTAAARLGSAPRVEAHAALERDSESFTGPSGTHWLAGIAFRADLYDGGERRARQSESLAREHRAESRLEWARASVVREVRGAYLEVRTAEQRLTVTSASAEQAEESRRILQNRYDAGLATMTELLAAQAAVLDARVARLAAQHDGLVARAQLERAAGRLTRDLAYIRSEEP